MDSNTIAREFPRQHVLVVIGLSIITLGIYAPILLQRHSEIIKRLLPENRIENWCFPLYLTTLIMRIVLVIPALLLDNPVILEALIDLVDLINISVGVIWLFKIRDCMVVLFKTSPGRGSWYNAFWTFIFGVLYLQFKINRAQEISGEYN